MNMFETRELNNWKLAIAFFALFLLFIFVAKEANAAVLQKPPANLGLNCN